MSVHVLRTESGHLEKVLDDALLKLRGGRADLALFNMAHAVQIALGVDEDPQAVPVEVRRRLTALTRAGGSAA